MGTPLPFTREKLVVGVLYSRQCAKARLVGILEHEFGPTDMVSEDIDFTQTSYYDREMGRPIMRFFASFGDLISPDRLADIKALTRHIETSRCSVAGSRWANLDPGSLSLSRFLLASTKDGSHRIPLHTGIYAEVTLVYEHGTYRPVEWTYPDYRDTETIGLLNTIRRTYRMQLKKE